MLLLTIWTLKPQWNATTKKHPSVSIGRMELPRVSMVPHNAALRHFEDRKAGSYSGSDYPVHRMYCWSMVQNHIQGATVIDQDTVEDDFLQLDWLESDVFNQIEVQSISRPQPNTK